MHGTMSLKNNWLCSMKFYTIYFNITQPAYVLVFPVYTIVTSYFVWNSNKSCFARNKVFMVMTTTTSIYRKSICQEVWWQYIDVSGNVVLPVFYSEVRGVNRVKPPCNETARNRKFYRCMQVPFHTDIWNLSLRYCKNRSATKGIRYSQGPFKEGFTVCIYENAYTASCPRRGQPLTKKNLESQCLPLNNPRSVTLPFSTRIWKYKICYSFHA